MKLRQKLAAVLAAAMVVTAVPVITMAETENKIVKNVSVIKKDSETKEVALRMTFNDTINKTNPEEFYFELTNAEWLKWNNSLIPQVDYEGASVFSVQPSVAAALVSGGEEVVNTIFDTKVDGKNLKDAGTAVKDAMVAITDAKTGLVVAVNSAITKAVNEGKITTSAGLKLSIKASGSDVSRKEELLFNAVQYAILKINVLNAEEQLAAVTADSDATQDDKDKAQEKLNDANTEFNNNVPSGMHTQPAGDFVTQANDAAKNAEKAISDFTEHLNATKAQAKATLANLEGVKNVDALTTSLKDLDTMIDQVLDKVDPLETATTDAFNKLDKVVTVASSSNNDGHITMQMDKTNDKVCYLLYHNQKIATYYRQGDKVVRVTIGVDADIEDGDTIIFPMPIKAKGGAVSVAVKGEGSYSTITEGSYTFLSTGEKAASLTVGDLKAFYDNGTLSDITLKETFLQSFDAKDMIVKIKLEDTDWEFVKSSNVKIEGSYGFDFKYASKEDDGDFDFDSSKIKFDIDDEDKSVAYIWLSKDLSGTNRSLGRIKITGLEVDSDEKDLTEGDLLADITTVESVDSDDLLLNDSFPDGGAELDKDYTDIALAKIANYSAYIKMKDEKAVDIVAGRDEEVVFEVIESVDDVFVGSRTITLDLKDNEGKDDKQFFMIKKDQIDKNQEGIFKDGKAAGIIDDDPRKIVEKVEFVWKEDTFEKEEKWAAGIGSDYYRAQAIKVTLKDQDKDKKDLNDNEEIDKFKVKTKVYVPVDQQEKKTVEITGEVRGVDEFKSATAVNVIDPFDVTFDKTTLKVGLQNQAAGKITIAEKDKEMLMKGDLIVNIVKGSKDQDGIVIEEKGDLTVTGDLKRTDFGDADSNKAEKVTLKRQSKAASTLEISNMEVTVDRTVPEGYYDIEIRGEAVDEYDGKYKVEEYIVIGTPNTQDITAGGLAKGTSTFVIGSTTYTMNDETHEMDAPAYIQDPGYTMVPVRYVAIPFGVNQKYLLLGNVTVTIFAGERTISLTAGSNVALVNGNPVNMGTAVVIKEGRTFAPAGEIARLIGVATAWDSATKTATFTN